jgi:hypothetical protein
MTRDSIVLVFGMLIAAVIWLVVIITAINKMVSRENDIAAIARIYMPSGCDYLGSIDRVPDAYLFRCGDNLTVVSMRW